MYRRGAAILIVIGIVVGITAATSLAGAQGAGARVLPPSASSAPYDELSAKWWWWALAIPASTNPLLDETGVNCHVGQPGPVFFLVGTYTITENVGVPGGVIGRATRSSCTVPRGKTLFFPLINAEADNIPVQGSQPTSYSAKGLANIAKGLIDSVDELYASVDGAAIPIHSPGGESASVPGI